MARKSGLPPFHDELTKLLGEKAKPPDQQKTQVKVGDTIIGEVTGFKAGIDFGDTESSNVSFIAGKSTHILHFDKISVGDVEKLKAQWHAWVKEASLNLDLYGTHFVQVTRDPKDPLKYHFQTLPPDGVMLVKDPIIVAQQQAEKEKFPLMKLVGQKVKDIDPKVIDEQFEFISDSIKKSLGVPMEFIDYPSLLVDKPKKEWDPKLFKSMIMGDWAPPEENPITKEQVDELAKTIPVMLHDEVVGEVSMEDLKQLYPALTQDELDKMAADPLSVKQEIFGHLYGSMKPLSPAAQKVFDEKYAPVQNIPKNFSMSTKAPPGPAFKPIDPLHMVKENPGKHLSLTDIENLKKEQKQYALNQMESTFDKLEVKALANMLSVKVQMPIAPHFIPLNLTITDEEAAQAEEPPYEELVELTINGLTKEQAEEIVKTYAKTKEKNLLVHKQVRKEIGTKSEPVVVWPFESSSMQVNGEPIMYKAQLNKDGTLSCNCMGWTMGSAKSSGGRRCKHTDAIEVEAQAIYKKWKKGESLGENFEIASSSVASASSKTLYKALKEKPSDDQPGIFVSKRVVEI